MGLPEAERGYEGRRGASDVPECGLIWAPFPAIQEQLSERVEHHNKTKILLEDAQYVILDQETNP